MHVLDKPTLLVFQGQQMASNTEFVAILPTEIFHEILSLVPDVRARDAFSVVSHYWSKQNSEVLEREQKKIASIASRFNLTIEPKNWKTLYKVQETILLNLKNLDNNIENVIENFSMVGNPEMRDRAIVNLLDDQRTIRLTCYSQMLELATDVSVKKQVFFHFLINTNQKISKEQKLKWSYMFIKPSEDTNLLFLSLGTVDDYRAEEMLKNNGDWLVRFIPHKSMFYLSVKKNEVLNYSITPEEKIKDANKVGLALEASRQIFEFPIEEVLTLLIDDLTEENQAEMQTIFYSLLNLNFDEIVLGIIKGNSFYQTKLKDLSVGVLDRQETEELLKAHPKGSWLIRYSTNTKGYVLSIRKAGRFDHRILNDGSKTICQLFKEDKISISKLYKEDRNRFFDYWKERKMPLSKSSLLQNV